jgi:hypothetical protein
MSGMLKMGMSRYYLGCYSSIATILFIVFISIQLAHKNNSTICYGLTTGWVMSSMFILFLLAYGTYSFDTTLLGIGAGCALITFLLSSLLMVFYK